MTLPEDSEKALSDDGSYEFVNFDEPDYRNNNFEEHLSAGSECKGNIKECSDVGTDDDSGMDNPNDHSDGSYEFVDSEETNNRMIECKEDLSADCKHQRIVTESSDTETDDGIEKNGIFQFRTVAYQKNLDDNVFIFPANIKLRQHMEIKDVVKDHVLPFLPAKSLLKFRAVSKEWDKWIASPFLAHKQGHCFQKISGFFQDNEFVPTFISLDRSAYGVPSPSLRFMPEPVVIKSSCNGLLLCRGRDGENIYYTCNPTNKEWRSLPQPKYYHSDDSKSVLVFEPSPLNFEAHFQVICAIPLPLFEGPIIVFEIYDSAIKSWKLSAVDCVELGNSVLIDNGFYLNGIVYWQTSGGELLAFDLKNEICGVQPLPRGTEGPGIVSQLDGELCYIEAHYQHGNNTCIVEIYGNFLSQKHTIQFGLTRPWGMNDCRVLSPVGSDVLTILFKDCIYTYNLEDGKVEIVGNTADFRGRYFPYVNSLVSLACN